MQTNIEHPESFIGSKNIILTGALDLSLQCGKNVIFPINNSIRKTKLFNSCQLHS